MSVSSSLDDYHIEHEIGESVYGRVFALSHTKNPCGKKVLKIVRKRGEGGNGVLEDFRRKELDRLLTLKHPHVNPLVMWSETEEEYRLVFEDFAGGEIAILSALAYLHSENVRHGGISGASVTLSSKLPDAVAKLTDCGLGVVFDPNNEILQNRPSVWHSGEQLSSGYSLPADDIWGVGVLAYYLLNSKLPFLEGETQSSVLVAAGGQPSGENLPSGGRVATVDDLRGLYRSGKLRFWDDDGWDGRSKACRDFVRLLLDTDGQRPTAAQLLHHEWIELFAKEHFEVAEELRIHPNQTPQEDQLSILTKHRPLEKGAISAGLLLCLSKLSPLVFDDLKKSFEDLDADTDGYLHLEAAAEVLAIHTKRSLEIIRSTLALFASVRVFDLATVCAAYVALRDVNVSGDEEQPLSDVNALFGALVDQVCRTSRSDRGGGRSASASSSQGDGGVVLQLSDLQKRSKSNVARQLEKYCDIDFAAMLADAGEELSPGSLRRVLLESNGRGIAAGRFLRDRPLDFNAYSTYDLDCSSWLQKLVNAFHLSPLAGTCSTVVVRGRRGAGALAQGVGSALASFGGSAPVQQPGAIRGDKFAESNDPDRTLYMPAGEGAPLYN